jgi:hypothetical protein
MPRAMIGDGFSLRAERWPFHVDVSAAVVNAGFCGAGAAHERLPQFLTNGMGKRYMRHDAPAKECVLGGFLGAVHKLVHEHDVARASRRTGSWHASARMLMMTRSRAKDVARWISPGSGFFSVKTLKWIGAG